MGHCGVSIREYKIFGPTQLLEGFGRDKTGSSRIIGSRPAPPRGFYWIDLIRDDSNGNGSRPARLHPVGSNVIGLNDWGKIESNRIGSVDLIGASAPKLGLIASFWGSVTKDISVFHPQISNRGVFQIFRFLSLRSLALIPNRFSEWGF